MKRVQFTIRYPERRRHPLQQRIMHGTAVSRAELLHWSPTDDATTLFWFDGEPVAVDTVLDSIDSLENRSLVPSSEGTYAFLQQASYEFPPELLELLAAAWVIFLPPVVFLESGNVRFEAVGEPTDISSFHDGLSQLGTLSIERVAEFDRGGSPSRLTARQEAALEAADAVGYYEVPRQGSVADVASRLDCSQSTAGELLRKAEAAVIEGFLGR